MTDKFVVSRDDHKALAAWAAECAGHVLDLFAQEFPRDERPRAAIEACRDWIETGMFSMQVIRGASLSAHAAARMARADSAAQFAARAAGQAAATPHVPTHALGPAWYGAKAADAAGREGERDWQYDRLPAHLRAFVLEAALARPVLAKVLRYPGMARSAGDAL